MLIRGDKLAMKTAEPRIFSSGSATRLETREVDDLAQYMKHADIELIQISRAQSNSKLTQVSFDNVNLQVGHYGAAYISNATTDKKRSGLVFKTNRDFPTTCNGYGIDSKSFMYYGENSEHLAINKGPCRWIYISFRPDYLEESLLEPLRAKLDARRNQSSCLRCQEQLLLDSFYAIVNEISELVNSSPLIFQNTDIIKGMEWSLLDSQMLVMSNALNSSAKNMERSKKSRESIIRQSIDFLKSNSYEPIHVLDLCNALNVGLRTLYYAYREYYGISPVRHLRLLRYAKARRDLIKSNRDRTTVTDIAAKWHFWHFGRFSVEYKALYGESPSETLNKGMGA